MDGIPGNRLPRTSMLKSKIEISTLLREGRYGYCGCIKYCFTKAEDTRILVSVPKKLFKRAVKRNLMKRRMREAFRTQRSLMGSAAARVMFIYTAQDILDSETIRRDMAGALSKIAAGR